MRVSSRRGFSLLEVMVAIAILGLTLTVILSAQGGLAASNRSAANMGTAIAAGRCKVTELEEKLLRFSFPQTDEIETEQACCDDVVDDVFKCDYKIEKIELPSMTSGNALGDGGSLTSMLSPSALPGMANAAGSAGLDLSGDGGLAMLGSGLASQFGMGMPGGPSGSAVGGMGAQGLLGMVMGIIYPSMKIMYEQSIRRVTVTVKWKEGPNARELPLTEFVTNPRQAGFAGGVLQADGGVDPTTAGSAAPGTPGGPGGGNAPPPPPSGLGR